MNLPENPFDKTVWDPIDSEQAAEDPLHGPSATFDMLSVPAMPLGTSEGLYWQPGGFYALGTVYFDALDKPVYRIGRARSTSAVTREMLALSEWVETSRQGATALTVLEAQRQRARLERNGVAYSFKPSDVCAGGRRLDDCQTVQSMMDAAGEYADSTMQDKKQGEGTIWNVLAWLGKTCSACSLNCQVAVQTRDGAPTGITRLSNTKPLLDIPVIRLDAAKSSE